MKKIFLSYSYNETEKLFVDNLQKELELHENQVINIMESINFGQNNVDALHNYINKCDLVIAILGNSLNVAYEIGYAIGKGKKILTVIDNIYTVPFDLTTIPSIFMRNNDKNIYDYDGTIREILNFVDKMENVQDKSRYLIANHVYEILVSEVASSVYTKCLNKLDEVGYKELNSFLRNIQETPDVIDEVSSKKLKDLIFKKINMLDQVDSKEFEDLIYNLLKNKEFNLTRAEKDSIGYDFILHNYKKFDKTLVEVKNYNINNKISVGQLQQFLGAIYFNKANYGIFISSSGYTRSARDFAENSTPKIELWDMSNIIEELEYIAELDHS